MISWPCFQTARLSARPLPIPKMALPWPRLPCATREFPGFHATAQSPWLHSSLHGSPRPRMRRSHAGPTVALAASEGASLWPRVGPAGGWPGHSGTEAQRLEWQRGQAHSPGCRNLSSPLGHRQAESSKGLMRRRPVPGLGGVRTQLGWSHGQRGGGSPLGFPRACESSGHLPPHKATGSRSVLFGFPSEPLGPHIPGTALTTWGSLQTYLECKLWVRGPECCPHTPSSHAPQVRKCPSEVPLPRKAVAET